MKKYENAINAAVDQFDKQVLTPLMDKIRQEVVVPYCDRHLLRFSAGMGSWSFHTQAGVYLWEEDMPKRVVSSLEIDYPFNPGQQIGSMLLSYTPAALLNRVSK